MKNDSLTTAPRKGGDLKRRLVPYRPPVLVPRGAFSRPAHAHLSIEIFEEQSVQFPTVHITAEAHGKMRALIEACPVEILWLSPTKVREDGDVIVYDVLVPHQVCTIGTTEKLKTADFDGEDHLLSELMDGRKYDMIRDLICWGHSHVNSGTFPSSVDESQTHYYLKSMREMGKNRFVRLIANKGDDLSASLYLLDEGRAIHHAPIQAESPEKGWEKWAKEQVAEKVTRPEPKHPVVQVWNGFVESLPFSQDGVLSGGLFNGVPQGQFQYPWDDQLQDYPVNVITSGEGNE